MATSDPSDNHVVLVGMMGAGKTAVGELLAKRLDRPFFDVDAWIEDEEGVSIATIFETRGEAAFRELEASVVPSFLAGSTACVLSVGGGAVTDERSRGVLVGPERVVWLRARHDTLAARVGDGSHRPLLAGQHDVASSLARLAEQRAPLYTSVADVIVDVDDLSPDEVVERIIEALA
jgi:shikimate kinase